MPSLDILIPVYNEGAKIRAILDHIRASCKADYRVLICYDRDDDDTLSALAGYAAKGVEIVPVKNQGRGVHAAVVTGFRASRADAVLVYPADDDANGGLIDPMLERMAAGYDVVAPSRFMRGGCMIGCRWQKALLVRTAAWLLHHAARVPTHDPTNGFRMFSRKLLTTTTIESTDGFTFSLELLVKARARGLRIAELPARWFERRQGQSRFRILRWLPGYLRWFFEAFKPTAVWILALWAMAVSAAYLAWVILPRLSKGA